MARKGPNIRQFKKRFPMKNSCLDAPYAVRFGDRLTCFKCQKQATYYRVKASAAHSSASTAAIRSIPTAGTPFKSTRTPLRDWFYVMFLFCASRNGVAAKEVQRQLGVTYKTAWRMCNLIRKYMGYVDGDYPLAAPARRSKSTKAFIGGKDKLRATTTRPSCSAS